MALNGLFCADVPLRHYSLTFFANFDYSIVRNYWLRVVGVACQTQTSRRVQPQRTCDTNIASRWQQRWWTVHKPQTSRGQYLALSKAWWSRDNVRSWFSDVTTANKHIISMITVNTGVINEVYRVMLSQFYRFLGYKDWKMCLKAYHAYVYHA